MRVAFIGCVDFSRRMLQVLIDDQQAEIVGIVTRGESQFNADFVSLTALADEYEIPFFLADNRSQFEVRDWLVAHSPEAVFCIGWSHLLERSILDLAPHGVIGYHPSDLPNNRGRHPIVWALALGLASTASTFFFMVKEADAGPVIDKQAVPISTSDDAASLYEKLADVAESQLRHVVAHLAAGTVSSEPQSPTAGNSWRKRSKADGRIDWRMASVSIYNLVRALTRPYVGAHCDYRGQEVRVWSTAVLDWPARNLEPGKILDVDDRSVTVKTGDGAIVLIDHEFSEPPDVGDYL